MTSEIQYIYLLNKLLEDGEERETRNGKTLSIFGYRMEFDLQEGFPLLTTKKMFFKGIMTELAWFLRGSTDVTELHKYNNRIWDLNTQDRDYDAGPVYGFQWRHFGADYVDCKTDYTGKGVDQIAQLIKDIQREENMSVLLITHDLGVVAETCEKVAVMYKGKIIEEASVDQIFKNPQHEYTKALIEAIPKGGKERLKVPDLGESTVL